MPQNASHANPSADSAAAPLPGATHWAPTPTSDVLAAVFRHERGRAVLQVRRWAIDDAGEIAVSGSVVETFLLALSPTTEQCDAALAWMRSHRDVEDAAVVLHVDGRPPTLVGPIGADALVAELTEARRRLAGDAGAVPGGDAPTDEKHTIILAEALDGIAAFLRRYIVFASDAQLVAVVLWIAHTHVLDAFDVSPYLGITSAEKGSGKSRLLELLEMLVARAWRMVSPTEAVVFRKVTKDRPTLLLDEGDATFAQVPEGLRGLLNAGHRRGTTVTRCGDQKTGFQPQDFQVFCPKAIAAIGELPGTIADRSIPIRLRRRTHAERVARFRFHTAQAEAAPLRESLKKWAPAAVAALRAAQPAVPEALNDRAAEGWEPIFAIADAGGGEWPARARDAALALHAHNRDEDSLGVQLLRAIREVFRERNFTSNGGPFTFDLLTALDAREGEPWHDALRIDTFRDPMLRGAAARLAKLLRPYGIHPRDARSGEKVAKGYAVADFADAFARLLGE